MGLINYRNESIEELAKQIAGELVKKHNSHKRKENEKTLPHQEKAIEDVFCRAIKFGRNAVVKIGSPVVNRGTGGNKIESKKYPGVFVRPKFTIHDGKTSHSINNPRQIGKYGHVDGFLGITDKVAMGFIGYGETSKLFSACEPNFVALLAAYQAEYERCQAEVDNLAAEYVLANKIDDAPRIQAQLGKALVDSGLKDEDPALILGFLQVTARSAGDLKNLMRFVNKYKGSVNFLDVDGVRNAINLANIEEVQQS
jgi:hypothetical protein